VNFVGLTSFYRSYVLTATSALGICGRLWKGCGMEEKVREEKSQPMVQASSVGDWVRDQERANTAF